MDLPLSHPQAVHLPLGLCVILPIFGAVVLASWRRQWLPSRAWALVFLLQVLALVGGVVAMRTGEAEEQRLEDRLPEEAVERHEEMAETFVRTTAGAALLGGAALCLHASHVGPWLALASVATSGAGLIFAIRTGASGGELVHRPGAAEPTRGRRSRERED